MPRKEDCFRVIKPKPKYDPETQAYVPEEPADPSLPPPAPEYDEKYFNEMTRRVTMKNAEVYSLRCDLQLKLWVADKFIDDTFYYPYNMDFRGRAYPMPPNLNHLGSDLCRGILLFADAKPLGPDGLMWMKVHLANLFGNNKITHAERVQWVDDNMDKVRECAANPLDGSRWWCEADEPFQALATCRELVAAIDSGDPAAFVSGMPVHQDGSCNGLQHYAALGRDEAGATAVNVKPSVRPQDVYTGVLHIVLKKIDADMAIPEDEADETARKRGKYARLLHGVVNRKVIKQTVMTSVYGVTRIGARAQVQARLEEKMMSEPGTVITPEKERELFEASRYVANLTLDSLSEMFSSAKEIMDWLGDCAALVASQGQMMTWVTPLGLPVCQPYRKSGTHTVRTILQNITLSVDDDALPVSKQKQRTAFPPNFVHSLDASHMLMTALKMKQQNITFAAVHDSYWTHAADIPAMNRAVRECFVELYEQPVLEGLHDSLTIRYPDIKFPPVPRRGHLDIKSVHDSAYFFH
jgi:DNA-directed RNA polymerase